MSQDENLRKTAQRILMSQLRQNIIKEKLDQHSTESIQTSSQYASNFSPLSSSKVDVDEGNEKSEGFDSNKILTSTSSPDNTYQPMNNNRNKNGSNDLLTPKKRLNSKRLNSRLHKRYTDSILVVSSSTKSSSAVHESNTQNNEHDDVDDELLESMKWEDGYTNLDPPKQLSDEEDSDGYEGHAARWALPDNVDDLDLSALASMPAHVRKELVEDARRLERQRRRQNYMPVAADPLLYSKTQLANFLRSRYRKSITNSYLDFMKIINPSVRYLMFLPVLSLYSILKTIYRISMDVTDIGIILLLVVS